MANVVKIAPKNFNADKLMEELAGTPVMDIVWYGFVPINDRVYGPFSGPPRVIEGHSYAGSNYTARSGELWFITSRRLTVPEDSALVSLLTAHDSTALTAEQVRQAQDESDLDALIASDRDAFLAAIQSMQTGIQGWDAATTAEKLAITKNFFILTRANMITIGKMMRLFIRSERGAAI